MAVVTLGSNYNDRVTSTSSVLLGTTPVISGNATLRPVSYFPLAQVVEGSGDGVSDHGALTGLTDDDHDQYALLSGRSGDTLLIDTIDEQTTGSGVNISNININDYTIKPEDGATTNLNLILDSKGTGSVYLGSPDTLSLYVQGGEASILTPAITTGSVSSRQGTIRGISGDAGYPNGSTLTIRGGRANVGSNGTGGNLYLYGGTGYGTGTRGNVYFGDLNDGFLPAKSTETNVVYYETTSGKLSYGTVETGLTSVDIADINATGTADNTTYLRGDGTWSVASSGGVTDHGGLTGLGDDDHTQYALLNGRSGNTLQIDDIAEFTTDHGVEIEGVTLEDGSIIFGDGDSYIYEVADDQISVGLSGTDRWRFTTSQFRGNTNGYPSLQYTAPTATVPVFCTINTDTTTGLGGIANTLSLIVSGTEEVQVSTSGITLSSGATVDTIETTLTDDDTHIPTSGAVSGALTTHINDTSNPHSVQLNEMSDLSISDISQDDILVWNNSLLTWENLSFSEAGVSETGHTHVAGDITGESWITGISGESLSDLGDVTITSIGLSEILFWNGTDWINQTLSEAGILSSSSLTDHTTDTDNPHDTSISKLTDTTIAAISDGHVLSWNNSLLTWENNTLAGAGIAAASHTHAASDITGETWISDISGESIDDLGDVALTSLGLNEILVYTDPNWVNMTLSEAGIATIADTAPRNATITSLSTNTTLSSAHNGRIVECTGTIIITLPNGMDTGYQVTIVNVGSGTITISASTTLQTKDSNTLLENQYSAASAYHRGSNVWVAFGDLTSV